MARGRSSEFDTHIVDGAREYLSQFVVVDDDEDGGKPKARKLPTVAGLCLHLEVGKTALGTWLAMESHPQGLVEDEIYSQLKECLDHLKCLAEEFLINSGLDGAYNPTIAKLLLHGHGHSDKIDTTLSAPDGSKVDAGTVFEFNPVGSDD